jgi:L-asparaginase
VVSDDKSILEVDKTENYFLLNNYDNPYNVDFVTTQPLNILSENMTISDWNILLRCLKGVDFSEFDGIIITHGTDTMAFTASMFGMILGGIKIPVIFIGSNFNLYDERADGHQNFADAVDFIKDTKLGGTFVITKSKVYLSTKITQSRHLTNSYGTPNDEVFGNMKTGIFEKTSDTSYPNVDDFEKIYLQTPLIDSLEQISDCVFIIRPYIGLSYENFAISNKTKAILHETYHSATACAEPTESANSIVEFYNKNKKNIDLYLAPFYDDVDMYSSTDFMLKAGIKTICNMSLESAYAKLLLAYSSYSGEQTFCVENVDEFLTLTLFFENMA